MHLYNSWLPPAVAEQTILEKEAFSEAVRRLQQDWQPQAPKSGFATLKWISVINNFLRAKSELAIEDVELLVKIILDIFFHSEDNSYLQARWGGVLSRFLKKYAKRLHLTLAWRPFYDLVVRTNFKRQHAFEGVAIKQVQINSLSKIIRKCRCFFPKGSAAEVWAEFRPMLDDLSHNVSLEAAGFISLFLSMNHNEDNDFFTSEWLTDCLHLWDGVPNCQYWNLQWASLVGRCIKNNTSMCRLELEPFVPLLFSHYLNSFEVPVGKMNASYPYQREVTSEVMFAFSTGSHHSLPKEIGKSIVFMLKPGGSAQKHLESMIDLLEQYFHPSNGGPWTSFLERFLRSLVSFFLKRLAKEQSKRSGLEENLVPAHFLTSNEREAFVSAMMRLIERGQFSKNSSLAKTAVLASSQLAYIEPRLVLPLSISRFHTALDTITATHQLEAALKTVALSARALLLASFKESSPALQNPASMEWLFSNESNEFLSSCRELLEFAMFHTLLGLDANDSPKTLATLQLFCSIFSSLGTLGCESDGRSSVLSIDWSQWLDDFLSRLFTLISHLESSNQLVESAESDVPNMSTKTFLLQGGSFYLSTLQVLFARLTQPLFEQALRKVAKFLQNQTLPGAVAEAGLLCSAVVYANPHETIAQIIIPIVNSVLLSLEECPPTGFSGRDRTKSGFSTKVVFSPALEASIIYKLNILSLGLLYGGESILQCKDLLKKVIAASFDAPSAKVNDAGSSVLSSVLGCTILFYPLDQYKLHVKYPALDGIEDWISKKSVSGLDANSGPAWHSPKSSEVEFANELLDLHLGDALLDLRSICEVESPESSGNTAQEKEHLRVILLRIYASLRGVRSCLPDFEGSAPSSMKNHSCVQPYFIAGATGASVGSTKLREDAANTLHLACEYLLKKRADDSILLSLLSLCIAAVGNSGSIEFSEWLSEKDSCHAESKSLVEPATNFVTDHHSLGQRRPKWMVIEMALLHNMWRASQSHYNQYRAEPETCNVPMHVKILTADLMKLSLHNYDIVRVWAGSSLEKVFKRFPSCIKDCMPTLLSSLKDPTAAEHTALGACGVLVSRPVLRFLTQDFNALSNFLLAILNSAHHETVKAQNAINELFLLFNLRFGGLSIGHGLATEESAVYADLMTKLQNFCRNTDSLHWRYNLMAQGMLAILAMPGSKAFSCEMDELSMLRKNVAGHFLSNLKSDFPPLRPMSVVVLLLLLNKSQYKLRGDIPQGKQKIKKEGALSLEAPLVSVLQEEDFGSKVLHNFSLDHNYTDGQTRARQAIAGRFTRQSANSATMAVMMPTRLRSWPRTRTWDSTMKGDAFSPKFAELFKCLVQECGPTVLKAFRRPLEEVANELDERGTQCAAAEIIAGFLQSDTEGVLEAWDDWMQPLFQKLALQSSVESTSDWAACIRFAVTGKGRTGRRPPLTRPLVLKCLAEPVAQPTSSSALVKHFTYLCAVLTELAPRNELADEILFQRSLLLEASNCMSNSAPQIRELVGSIMCVVGSNLQLSLSTTKVEVSVVKQQGEDCQGDTASWKALMVSEANAAATKVQNDSTQQRVTLQNHVIAVNETHTDLQKSDNVQDAVKPMETVLYFIIAAVKSGRSLVLMDLIVELLQWVLSLQETSHKELSSLAKLALHFLKFQLFPVAQLPRTAVVLLSSAKDTNWHTRIATLTFLQSFLYRHTFLLARSDLLRIWNNVENLLSDGQLEVREMASVTLAGMMKGTEHEVSQGFRERQMEAAIILLNSNKSRRGKDIFKASKSPPAMHGTVLGLAACVLSVPYDMPRWLPKTITTLARFAQEPPPVRTTVTKTVAEFRRTHADTWSIQKSMFTEEESEILTNTSSSASYFA